MLLGSKGHLLQKATPLGSGDETDTLHIQKQIFWQNEALEKYVPKQRMRQNLRKILNKIQISNLPDKEFRALVIKMLIKLGRRIEEHSQYVNKEIENTKKKQ